MKSRTQTDGNDDLALLTAIKRVAKEPEVVKRLLIALLLKLGATSDEIAMSLGIGPSVLRAAIPSRKIKRMQFTREGDDRA